MESLSMCLSSSSPPFRNYSKTRKSNSKPVFFLPNDTSTSNSTSHLCNSYYQTTHFAFAKKTTAHHPFHQFSRISIKLNPLTKNLPILKIPPSLFQILLNTHLSFLSLGFSFPLTCFASETTLPSDQVSNKINLEAILVSIDDFFNRYPFFVAGVTFVWLVVIPLTEEYLQKVKFISAIDAFRKLRDDPSVQLLDIRDEKSLRRLSSPNLKFLNKSVLQVEFCEGDEDGFVKNVLENFREPANTTICILGSVDENSMKVAELLFRTGFREAYAVRGGVRGKNGWLAIQETLLPPSVHIFPKKRDKKSKQFKMNGGVNWQSENADRSSSVSRSRKSDNGCIGNAIESTAQTKNSTRPLSPYPMYADMKPPSSPTPSKPKS